MVEDSRLLTNGCKSAQPGPSPCRWPEAGRAWGPGVSKALCVWVNNLSGEGGAVRVLNCAQSSQCDRTLSTVVCPNWSVCPRWLGVDLTFYFSWSLLQAWIQSFGLAGAGASRLPSLLLALGPPSLGRIPVSQPGQRPHSSRR